MLKTHRHGLVPLLACSLLSLSRVLSQSTYPYCLNNQSILNIPGQSGPSPCMALNADLPPIYAPGLDMGGPNSIYSMGQGSSGMPCRSPASSMPGMNAPLLGGGSGCGGMLLPQGGLSDLSSPLSPGLSGGAYSPYPGGLQSSPSLPCNSYILPDRSLGNMNSFNGSFDCLHKPGNPMGILSSPNAPKSGDFCFCLGSPK